MQVQGGELFLDNSIYGDPDVFMANVVIVDFEGYKNSFYTGADGTGAVVSRQKARLTIKSDSELKIATNMYLVIRDEAGNQLKFRTLDGATHKINDSGENEYFMQVTSS